MPGHHAESTIVDVWESNLEETFRRIRVIVQQFNYVAMDTEFPGVVARPIGEFRSNSEYQYQLHRCNVDLLKIIQLGFTFCDEMGNFPTGAATFQFNFKFNLTEDMYAQDSIDLLTNSGIQFKKHDEEGVDVMHFAELLMTSGVILDDNVRWITFHSGYDFSYLLKVLTVSHLPSEETEFFELLRIYFPRIYDVKYLMKSCKDLKGGLQEVADFLQDDVNTLLINKPSDLERFRIWVKRIQRVGPQHQAGSDSLLTQLAFFKMRESYFEDNIDDDKYCGHLYGLGSGFTQNGNYNEEINNATTNATTTT